jgi:hypothetical protein
MIIGAVVGVVALVGGAVALLGGGDGEPGRNEVNVTTPTVPPGTDPLDPSSGPGATIPTPDPVAPVDPGGEVPVVTEPVTPTTAPPPPPPPPADGAIPVGGGVSVAPPSGWSVANQEAGFAHIVRDAGGAQAFISVYDSSLGSSFQEATTNYVAQAIEPAVTQLELQPAEETNPVAASVVSNGFFALTGVLASQNGNTPVEGWVALFVRNDGTVVVYEEMSVLGEYESFKDDYELLFQSLIATL